MITTEGWVAIMNRGMDTRGENKQPEQDHQVWMSLYFVSLMIIGNLFLINLFVGVIIDNFNRIKESEEIGGKGLLITSGQRKWIEVQNIMMQKSLIFQNEVPKNK